MHCKKCLHYEVCVKLGKPSLYGINQEIGCSAYKDKTKWVGNKFDGCDYKDCPYRIEPITNADRIRSMSDEELAEFIHNIVDEDSSHNVACYGCINYGTHHSDPANKGTYLYECGGCENEGIGLDVLMWLQQPAEEE